MAPSRYALACLIAVAVSAPAHGQSTGDEVRHPAIDSLARSLVDEHVPGLALLVVKDGRAIHRAAYGLASIEGQRPVTLHTPFYIASTAKMLTAAAVLALADEGRLSLEDPIGRWLDVVPGYAADVTVAQLLSHTSGLVDHYDIGGEERAYSNEDVLRILREAAALRFEPGTRAAYSNSGYVLLALLVERATGRPFGGVLEERFFEPLGMTDAFLAAGGAERPAHRAFGYRAADGSFEPYDYASSTSGAGGVYASLSDLEAWYRALEAGRVLSPATLRMASRPPELPGGRLTPYGMGWLAEFAARGPLKDRWYVLAYGSLRGFRSVFQWYQQDDLLMVWLANGDGEAVLDTLHVVPELVLREAAP